MMHATRPDPAARGGLAVGRAVEVVVSLAAAALAIRYVGSQGLSDAAGAWLLVAMSPLVGEFAVTMAWRYRPDMTIPEAAARFLKPSGCDSCGVQLSQFDILPVVPYVLRRGRCSCRRFAVPADCTVTGLAVAGLAALVASACMIAGVPASRPVALLLAFVPAVVADVVHGEVDEPLIALAAVPALLAPMDPWYAGVASAALLVFNLWGSSLLVRLAGRGRVPPCGTVDILASAALGLYLTIQDAVDATCWLVVLLFASHVGAALFQSCMPADGRYGVPGGNGTAVPALPAIALSGVLGLTWHFWA